MGGAGDGAEVDIDRLHLERRIAVAVVDIEPRRAVLLVGVEQAPQLVVLVLLLVLAVDTLRLDVPVRVVARVMCLQDRLRSRALVLGVLMADLPVQMVVGVITAVGMVVAIDVHHLVRPARHVAGDVVVVGGREALGTDFRAQPPRAVVGPAGLPVVRGRERELGLHRHVAESVVGPVRLRAGGHQRLVVDVECLELGIELLGAPAQRVVDVVCTALGVGKNDRLQLAVAVVLVARVQVAGLIALDPGRGVDGRVRDGLLAFGGHPPQPVVVVLGDAVVRVGGPGEHIDQALRVRSGGEARHRRRRQGARVLGHDLDLALGVVFPAGDVAHGVGEDSAAVRLLDEGPIGHDLQDVVAYRVVELVRGVAVAVDGLDDVAVGVVLGRGHDRGVGVTSTVAEHQVVTVKPLDGRLGARAQIVRVIGVAHLPVVARVEGCRQGLPALRRGEPRVVRALANQVSGPVVFVLVQRVVRIDARDLAVQRIVVVEHDAGVGLDLHHQIARLVVSPVGRGRALNAGAARAGVHHEGGRLDMRQPPGLVVLVHREALVLRYPRRLGRLDPIADRVVVVHRGQARVQRRDRGRDPGHHVGRRRDLLLEVPDPVVLVVVDRVGLVLVLGLVAEGVVLESLRVARRRVLIGDRAHLPDAVVGLGGLPIVHARGDPRGEIADQRVLVVGPR